MPQGMPNPPRALPELRAAALREIYIRIAALAELMGHADSSSILILDADGMHAYGQTIHELTQAALTIETYGSVLHPSETDAENAE